MLVGLFLILSQALPVRAHEPFDVGPYRIEVGWAVEPPVTWQQNSVEVIVTFSANSSGVTGLADKLTITLFYGGQDKVFSGAAGLIRTTDTNGTYHAAVILTQPGSYNATVHGTIGNTPINLKATPDKFERVVDGYDNSNPGGIMFPGSYQSPSALQASTADLNNRANTSMLMGYAGIAFGIVGIAIGTLALMRRPKTAKG